MNSLFAKIFLWFWLAITVVIAAMALVTWLYPYSVAPGGMLPDRLHDLQARGALAVYELKGVQAFEEHRRQLESASRLRTYFIDESRNEIGGLRVPDDLLEFADAHKEALERGDRVSAGQPSRLAIPIVGNSGRRYIALAERSRSLFGPSQVPGERAFGRSGERSGDGESSRRDGRRRDDAATQPATSQPMNEREGGWRQRDGERGSRRGGGPPSLEQSPRFELLVPAHVLLLRLLAGVLAAGFGCYLLARYLTSPVRHLQNAARSLAAGDLTARVGKSIAGRRDEIGELGREFNRMAGRVETVLSTQRRLLRDVSHELRSPLSRLNVAIELAGRDTGESAAPALLRASRESDRLNELIGQLLALARLEAGAPQAERKVIDLESLVREVVADADFEAEAFNRRVRLSRAERCTIQADASLIRSAVENAIRNAIQHTAEGTSIDVVLSRMQAADGASRAVVEVRDQGPGVPDEALERIFDPFFRVSDARERGTGGAGLGLAISRRAVDAHGGTVTAHNHPQGGLVVRIEIPMTT